MAKTEQKEEVAEADLPDRFHSEKCPGINNPDDLEWDDRIARTGKHKGHRVEVTRCVRCGGQRAVRVPDDD